MVCGVLWVFSSYVKYFIDSLYSAHLPCVSPHRVSSLFAHKRAMKVRYVMQNILRPSVRFSQFEHPSRAVMTAYTRGGSFYDVFDCVASSERKYSNTLLVFV